MEERRDDWHNSVDARLVNLTSAQKSADSDLEKIHRELSKIDGILRGQGRDKGIIGTTDRLETEVNKFNRVFFDKDYLGHGDAVAFLIFLYNQEKDRAKESDKRSGYKWAFWTAVLVAVIGLAGLVVTNKDQIEKWLPQKRSTLDVQIEKAKHPKSPHKIFVVHHVKAKAADQDAPAPEETP